jgi:hypothetical protein
MNNSTNSKESNHEKSTVNENKEESSTNETTLTTKLDRNQSNRGNMNFK